MGSNSEIQGYNMYPMLHFHRKFSSGITLLQRPHRCLPRHLVLDL